MSGRVARDRKSERNGLVVSLLIFSLPALLASLLAMVILGNVMAPLVQTGADPLVLGGCAGTAVASALALAAILRERPGLKLALVLFTIAAGAGFTGGIVLAWIGNAALASGPPERRIIRILAAESRYAGRGPPRHVVVVPNWTRQRATVELEVGHELSRYASGGCIEVVLRPGSFGAPRLADHRPVSCPSS